jgi:Outer membrane receptor for ferrienterochelin and colicins
LSSVGALAQSAAGAGTVNGVVRDPDGEGLPGADVILTNEAMGLRRATETTIDGVFDVPALIPATGYRLKVTRKGFAGWESRDLQVPAGRALVFDISLAASAGSEADSGASVVRVLEGSQPGPSVLITREQIDELPARGRRLDALVREAPGVSSDFLSGRLTFLGRPSSNSILVDGIVTDNSSSSDSASIATRVSQDSVEDVEVLSGGFPAQLGGTSGGIINIATRSGTNAYHGAFYDYYRNPGGTAAGRYALGHNLAGGQQQPGASFGGPILKNRLFFFSNFEGSSSDSQVLNRITNPLIADSSGASVQMSNCRATTAQCAAAARFIEAQMNILAPSPTHSAAGIAKLDYHRGQRDSFRFEVRDSHWHWPDGVRTETVEPNGGVLGQGSLRVGTRYLKVGWTAALAPTATNELAFGIFRDRVSRSSTPTGLTTGALSISVAGATLGSAQPYRTSVRELHRNQAGDQLRVTSGSHTLQLGVSFSENPHWINELYDSNGAYQYASLTAFAQDFGGGGGKNYTTFTQTLGGSDRKFRIREFSTYVQDSWRVSRRLTVDAGLRWDKAVLPQPVAYDSYYYRTGIIPSPNLAFSPRIGLAYLLNDRTVARFGFGFFYAPFSGEFIDALLLGNAGYQTNITVVPTYTGATAFPNVVTSIGSVPAGTKNLAYAAAKFRYPYTPQTTLAIERRLSDDTSLELRYVASPGRGLLTAKDLNVNDTSTSETYTLLDAGGQTAGSFTTPIWIVRGSTNYSHVFEISNGGSSSYQAMMLRLHKSMSHGLSAQASYTLSRALSNANGPWAVASVPLSTYSGDPDADRGSSNTDQRHRAVLKWSWRPALNQNAPALTRYLLNGWQHSAIVTLASSLPATPVVVVSGQQFSGTSMIYTSSMNGSGGWARVPFSPVNSLRKGAEYNVDVRLARSIPFTERISANLAFEGFNLFNKQFTTSVNTIAYVASGGVLKPVGGVGEPIAASAPRSAQAAFRLVF